MSNARDLLYFAGSVPLPNCEDVFRALNVKLGNSSAGCLTEKLANERSG